MALPVCPVLQLFVKGGVPPIELILADPGCPLHEMLFAVKLGTKTVGWVILKLFVLAHPLTSVAVA